MRESIRTEVGKTFAIRLDATASSGYRWKLLSTKSKQIVKLLNEAWEQRSLFGSSSVQIFMFQALLPGHTTIEFGYIGGREIDKILQHLTCHVEISD